MNSETIKTGRIFPLYLAPIDWYFLCDDSPDYPMVFYVELDFSGHIDQGVMSEALDQALLRHPLLYSIVQPAKKNRPCWVLASELSHAIEWIGNERPLKRENEFHDIRQSPGLRIWVREADGITKMTLQFHHAACDGTGAYRFVGDLMGCYMSRLACCTGKVELGKLDLSQLKNRPTKMRSLRAGDNFLHKTLAAYGEAWRTFGYSIAELKSLKTDSRTSDAPGMVIREFSADQLTSLRQVATSRGATFNDLMLCRMFQVVMDWNAGAANNRKIRVMVPSDMRDGEDFEIPACNMTAYTFINRRATEIADEAKLLQLICDDTLQIKNGSRQKSFMNGLTSAMATPFVLSMFLKRNVCLATTVLSNAGDPSRRFTCRLPKSQGKISCDDFTLEGITGVPPLRRKTKCTLSSSIYGRKLTFSMRCDPHSFSPADSGKLMDMFCSRLMVDA